MSYLRQAGIGAATGLGLGVLLGLALTLGLGLHTTVGLLSALLAMGAGATAGAFLGRAPWHHSGLLESGLRIVIGLALGPLLLTLVGNFLPITVPFAVLEAPAGTLLHELPLLYVPLVTAVYGLLLGLEAGTGRAGTKPMTPERR